MYIKPDFFQCQEQSLLYIALLSVVFLINFRNFFKVFKKTTAYLSFNFNGLHTGVPVCLYKTRSPGFSGKQTRQQRSRYRKTLWNSRRQINKLTLLNRCVQDNAYHRWTEGILSPSALLWSTFKINSKCMWYAETNQTLLKAKIKIHSTMENYKQRELNVFDNIARIRLLGKLKWRKELKFKA